ncbi:BON domain-containing protein [Magnetospirillum sp. SS-4]|uniref:BON domain-containing protein n=1 Tax=Magnetospirillum sp. SS-4 TaxID=2681465 RepID=UPI00137D6055|nr:BON domain-containing protein [Magnetospirillum sp. SS-4]CAA7622819.1 Periplasmic or secreted lipoprotein [Magnetospirillum sp. SS-4]
MKTRLSLLLLPVLLLAACAAPPPPSPPQPSAVKLDPIGRVIRARGERDQDDAMGRGIRTALLQDDSAAFKGVSVLAWDGVVLLSGAVSKPEHRRRAARIARDRDGVRVVHDGLVLAEDPGAVTYLADTGRERRIFAGLMGNDDIAGAYVVRVVNGIATLLGTTRSAADLAKASAFARDVEGIKWVVEHVEVR